MGDINEWDNWEEIFRDKGVSDEFLEFYKPYVEKLQSANLPIIFEFEHLALLLGLSKGYLASAVNGTSAHYRQFSIPKRRGGKRQIMAPYPALLHCQRWLYHNILSSLPVHDAAHGFVPNRSIISNAAQHLGAKCLLTMDLSDFFGSIKINRVMQTFLQLGYANNVAFYLSAICTVDECLPQGAATSPTLSNIIAYHFDQRLHKLSHSYGLTYTRYADDMTFSGSYIPHKFIDIVRNIAIECEFLVNENKTRLRREPAPFVVTGLLLKENKLTINRQMRRDISRDVYFIQKYGYLSHVSNRKIRDPLYLDRLIGKCNFWSQVEPDNSKVSEWCNALLNISRTLSA